MTQVADLGREVPFPVLVEPTLLVIGYAGRDEASVRHHIDELAAIGIAPPPNVPMVYELPAELVTTDELLAVHGARTSGEVEPVLVRAAGAWHLAVGSDHTDRELEAVDVRDSKAACPKPLSRTAIRLDRDPATGGLDDAWDAIEVTSEIDGVAYQRGTLVRPAGAQRPHRPRDPHRPRRRPRRLRRHRAPGRRHLPLRVALLGDPGRRGWALRLDYTTRDETSPTDDTES